MSDEVAYIGKLIPVSLGNKTIEEFTLEKIIEKGVESDIEKYYKGDVLKCFNGYFSRKYIILDDILYCVRIDYDFDKQYVRKNADGTMDFAFMYYSGDWSFNEIMEMERSYSKERGE